MHGLGTLYVSQGRHDEAEPLLTKALEITNDLLGKNNWQALHIMNTLSKLYTAQGHFVEAERQYIETLKAQRDILGNDHPHTLASDSTGKAVWATSAPTVAGEFSLQVSLDETFLATPALWTLHVVAGPVAIFRDSLNSRPTGVRQAQQLPHLVERFAGRVVPRLSQQ